jgi:hypothetical protein
LSEANVSLQEYGEITSEDTGGALAEPVVGNVSPYVIGYLENLSSILTRSVCPSDALKPVPSTEYATSLGITADRRSSVPSQMDMIRWALLRGAVQSVATVTDKEVTSTFGDLSNDPQKHSLQQRGPSSLIQLNVDIGFLLLCFFQRNIHGFGGDADEDAIETARSSLSDQATIVDRLLRGSYNGNMATLLPAVEEKHRHVLEVCDLFLSALFGEDAASRSLGGDITIDVVPGSSNAVPIFHPPLQSSRRFALLPIHTDRSISELQLRGKIGKDEVIASFREEAGSSVIGSGLGFFSSMLKKK